MTPSLTTVSSDPRLQKALAMIAQASFVATMPQQYQLKVGRLNYYWTSGKITVDSGPKVAETGIETFVALLRSGAPSASRPGPALSTSPHHMDVAAVSTEPTYDPNDPPF